MQYQDTMFSPASGSRAALLDLVQMLTGLALVVFMYLHALFVASILLGPQVFNTLADFFERYYLAQVGGPLLALVFLTHFFMAARRIPFSQQDQKKVWSFSRMLAHRDTWLWTVQVVTAMIILIMGAIHIWVVLTDLPITADKSAARIQTGFWLGFYLLLLPMVELHVGVGWYRLGVKWGVIKSSARKKAKRAEYYITGFFILLGLITLARFMFVSVS